MGETKLWKISLGDQYGQPTNQNTEYTCYHAHATTSMAKLIYYYQQSCFSPKKSTWLTAIKNNKFLSWPRLTYKCVQKYLTNTMATAKGHMAQNKKNVRSTSKQNTAKEGHEEGN